MLSSVPILLTVSQAFLAGALPAPRYFGQLGNPENDGNNQGYGKSPNDILTLYSGAGASWFTYGPPHSTSYPDGDPFTIPGARWDFRPDATASGEAPASPTIGNGDHVNTDSGARPGSNDGYPSYDGDPGSQSYTSAITFADPHLSIQTVTITALPSSQEPTVTSARQNSPDTSGVRELQFSILQNANWHSP